MTAVLQTSAHMETRALLLMLCPLNQTPVHSVIVLRGKQGFPPIHRGKLGGHWYEVAC